MRAEAARVELGGRLVAMCVREAHQGAFVEERKIKLHRMACRGSMANV